MGNAALATSPQPAFPAALDHADEAEEMLLRTPQVDCPVRHDFAPGIYLRTCKMFAGMYVIGHRHKTACVNIALTGRALIYSDGEVEEIVAPCVFIAKPGVRKMALVIEDIEWMNVHPNPSNTENLVELAELFIEKSAAFIGYEKELQALKEANHD